MGPSLRLRFGGAGILSLLVALTACAKSETLPDASSARADSWFAEVSSQAGINFDHAGGSAGTYGTPEITGSGGAVFDYDGDGDVDIYLVNVSSPSATPENQLFRQEEAGTYVDVTLASGLGDRGYGMGAIFGDVDNDGDPDVLVTNLGPDKLYLNNGDGSFRSGGPRAGVGADLWSTSACFFDYDRDGNLDLYVATYLHFDPSKNCTDRAGNSEFCGPEAFRGIPDRLYRGSGDGSFSEVSREALPGQPSNKALGVVCTDLDDDGLPDVYVANDGEQNQLWINRGDGTFAESALLSGAALDLFGRPEAGMGVVAGDLDGDLDLDLFLTHLDRETNTYYANLGGGAFEDRTPVTGLGPTSLPHTGFGTALFDADHDGDLDLAVVNGRVRRGASLSDREARQRLVRKESSVPAIFDEYAESDLFFLNDGSGSFRDASAEAGWKKEPASVSRGLLVDDLDQDGDPDCLVTSSGSRARFYRNDHPAMGHYLAVYPIDGELKREALGARIEIETQAGRWVRIADSSYGYLTARRPRAHFGLGTATLVDRLTVRWPDGGRSEFSSLPVDRSVSVLRTRINGSELGAR